MDTKDPASNDAPAATNGLSTETKNDTKPSSSNDHNNNNNSDAYSLKVKSEYILSERATSLPPLPIVESGSGGGGDDDRDRHESGDSKKKKRRGQNKKRPRDARQDNSEKICLALLRGEACPYGDGCKFSHDLKGYMSTRPSDIVEVEGGCPTYNATGFCQWGIMCRVGGNHITKTGENLRKEAADGGETKETTTIEANILPRDVQIQLRKKKYRKYRKLPCFSHSSSRFVPSY
jgi:tRNA-dihydrouridine synthase 3